MPAFPQRMLLPRNNLSILDRHEAWLTERQKERLSAVQYRIETYPGRFGRPDDDYAATAGIILMSDWSYAHRFTHCCMCNRKCKMWKFCPHCAYVREKKNVEKFLPLFPKAEWQFVTLSFKGELRFEVPDDDQPAIYWNAIRKALRQSLEEYHFDGAFWVEELYVKSLWPSLVVLPHCHAIIHASEISDAARSLFEEVVSDFRDIAWNWESNEYEIADEEKVERALDIKVDPITNPKQFLNNLRYLTKPIELAQAYRRGINSLESDGQVVELNHAVDNFLNAVELHLFERQQIFYIGSLDAKRGRKFLGNNKKV